MYDSCLFCSSGLGSNQEIEHLPVGKRVAFDPGRGRLWVVCPRCGRWNLCPFEERWEALEQSERLARTSAVREEGEELSLLQHPSGLSLIRVGRPSLSELVSWRFARSLVWRRRGFAALTVGVIGAGGIALLGGAAGTVAAMGISFFAFGKTLRDQNSPAVRMETKDGRRLEIPAGAARGATLRSVEGEPVLEVDFRRKNGRLQPDPHRIDGPDILHFLTLAMPYVNEEGASERMALDAASAIQQRGGREQFLTSVLRDRELLEGAVLRKRLAGVHRKGVLAKLPRPVRLAVEAASHVEQEERALAGELEGIVAEWREAEQIAEISDALLEPPGWSEFRARQRPEAAPDARPPEGSG